ncbi:WbqC family protein [Balneolaceae bacterium ANBcel3]|nr:WbqC family protein [Balneolaceae bacterium ANBcel3]
MKVALLLPGYSPTLSWLARARTAGHVLLDDLHSFSRKSQVHRTKIRTPDGIQWLRIPIVNEDKKKPLASVRIDNNLPWMDQHIRALEYNYRNSMYFDYYEPEIRSDLRVCSEKEYLLDAVLYFMERQWEYFQLPEFPATASRSLGLTNEILRSAPPETLSAWHDEVYHIASSDSMVLQEPNSRNYQRPHPNTTPFDPLIPTYRQHFPGFFPDCGILDLLFQYGPECWRVLDQLP